MEPVDVLRLFGLIFLMCVIAGLVRLAIDLLGTQACETAWDDAAGVSEANVRGASKQRPA